MASVILMHDRVGAKKFPVDKPTIGIGRHPDNDIHVADKVVSTKHAVIEVPEDPDQKGPIEYFIRDLDSTNGTFVNGEKITRQKLNNDDVIRVGVTSFKFEDEGDLDPDETQKIRKSWFPGVYYTKD